MEIWILIRFLLYKETNIIFRSDNSNQIYLKFIKLLTIQAQTLMDQIIDIEVYF